MRNNRTTINFFNEQSAILSNDDEKKLHSFIFIPLLGTSAIGNNNNSIFEESRRFQRRLVQGYFSLADKCINVRLHAYESLLLLQTGGLIESHSCCAVDFA